VKAVLAFLAFFALPIFDESDASDDFGDPPQIEIESSSPSIAPVKKHR
jgi:hypothetical protein